MGDCFNENLKEARLAAGMSQKDVAEKIGAVPPYIVHVSCAIDEVFTPPRRNAEPFFVHSRSRNVMGFGRGRA